MIEKSKKEPTSSADSWFPSIFFFTERGRDSTKLNLFVVSEPQRNLPFPSAGDLKVQAAKLIKGTNKRARAKNSMVGFIFVTHFMYSVFVCCSFPLFKLQFFLVKTRVFLCPNYSFEPSKFQYFFIQIRYSLFLSGFIKPLTKNYHRLDKILSLLR